MHEEDVTQNPMKFGECRDALKPSPEPQVKRLCHRRRTSQGEDTERLEACMLVSSKARFGPPVQCSRLLRASGLKCHAQPPVPSTLRDWAIRTCFRSNSLGQGPILSFVINLCIPQSVKTHSLPCARHHDRLWDYHTKQTPTQTLARGASSPGGSRVRTSSQAATKVPWKDEPSYGEQQSWRMTVSAVDFLHDPWMVMFLPPPRMLAIIKRNAAFLGPPCCENVRLHDRPWRIRHHLGRKRPRNVKCAGHLSTKSFG
ncbi:uncharacterized protein LOC122234897 [Panthera tigris]|uniref:uncharacterized protein LOC122234897 n=1 Tax=Panthera tigris TaxID=9694 RepID=UPI001C6F738B|nr:uncharacterized protein LOC122234897 [Panthera tigris]